MIMDSEDKQIHIRIPKELFTKLKVKCAFEGISIQEYLIALITEKIGKKSNAKGSILIVDDEAVVRESFRDALKDTHNVTITGTGEEALDLVSKKDFDIVIVDIRLPGKNGLDVVKEIRNIRPYIRSIIITAYPSVEQSVQAMKLGAVDFLVKPVRIDDLENLIQELLQKKH
jgi:DNA-binding NtrC family response regulator